MHAVTTETTATGRVSDDVDAVARPLLHNGNFGLLLIGQFVSQLGDRLAAVAFPVLVYSSTGSTLSTGVVLALYTLPYLVFGPFAGVAVDRFDRRRLMVLVDVARAALVVLVPVVASRSLAGTFALSFATASLGVLFDPAKMSLLPDVVERSSLLRANSLLETAEKLTEILGYAAAGLLLAAISTTSAFRIDAGTYMVSALALVLMRTKSKRPVAGQAGRSSARAELREGLAYLRRHRGLLANTVLVTFSAIGVGASYPLTFFLAYRVFDRGAAGFGTLEAAIAVGYLVGSIIVAGLGRKMDLGLGVIGGLVAMGVCLGLVALTGDVWVAALPFAAFGLANAFALIAIDTYVQRVVPEKLRGRVWGVRMCLTQGAWAAAIIATGALASTVSVDALLVVAALIISVPAALAAFVPAARDI